VELDDYRIVEQDDALMFKARPATEGAKRFVWIEPSNEERDAEREIILRKAVVAAWPHYKQFGNLDREHWTMRPPQGVKPWDAKYFEIGRPRDFYPDAMVLKAEIYQGEGRGVEQANLVWDMLKAGAAFYPSMGGKYLARRCEDDGCVVSSFLWSNTALADEPVNKAVRAVSTLPFDTFLKAVTSGYATDIAGMTGGRAMQLQSIGRGVAASTPAYRRAARTYVDGLGTDACPHTRAKPSIAAMVSHFRECGGMDDADAQAATARLLKQMASTKRNRSRLAA